VSRRSRLLSTTVRVASQGQKGQLIGSLSGAAFPMARPDPSGLAVAEKRKANTITVPISERSPSKRPPPRAGSRTPAAPTRTCQPRHSPASRHSAKRFHVTKQGPRFVLPNKRVAADYTVRTMKVSITNCGCWILKRLEDERIRQRCGPGHHECLGMDANARGLVDRIDLHSSQCGDARICPSHL